MIVIGGDFLKYFAGIRVLHIRNHGPQFFRFHAIVECLLVMLIHPASNGPRGILSALSKVPKDKLTER